MKQSVVPTVDDPMRYAMLVTSIVALKGFSSRLAGRISFPVDWLTHPSFPLSTAVWRLSPTLPPYRHAQFQNRSGGTRGAGMEILRGSKGSDFEGRALVKSAGSETSCGPLRWLTGCFGRGAHNGRDEHKEEKHLLVKGLYCFVFYKIDDLAPRYAISLSSLKAVVTDSKPGLTVVTLETKQGDVGYELWFEDMLHAKKFRDVVAEKARISKLHHAHPPMVRMSMCGESSILTVRALSCFQYLSND